MLHDKVKKYKQELKDANIPGSPWWIAAALKCWDNSDYKLIAGIDGGVYLARFWLTVPQRDDRGKYLSCNSLVLHHFLQKDPDRHLHNHPQSFTSQILAGGYIEEVEGGFNTYNAGDVNNIGRDHYHKVVEMQEDTWSLVHTGHRQGDWGFKVDGQHIPYMDYLSPDLQQYDMPGG